MNDHQSDLIKYVPAKCEKCGCEIVNLNLMCVPCAVKQAEPVAWEVVFRAVKQAIMLCKNVTGEHSRISTYVNAVQITHDALGTDNTHPAKPVAADHTGLIKRIDAAIERVTKGWGLMTIPADPRSDVDLVLSECKALLQGENPPFWATDFHPAQPVQADGLRQAALIDLAYINGAKAGWNMCVADDESQFKKLTEGVVECVKVLKNTRPQESAHPVQPAEAQGEPVAKYKVVPVEPTQAMKAAGQKRIDELATDGIERYWQDIYGEGYKAMIDIAPTDPAAAINEQLYTALEGLLAITRDSQGVAGYHLNGVIAKWDEFEEVSAADAALKSAKEHGL